jgi:dTDP-glucose 4,6-dehydratase
LQSLDAVEDDANYRFVQLDIVDGNRTAVLIEEFKPDVIVHLAVEAHVDRSIDCAAPFIETNVTGTCTLLDVARKYWAKLAPARRRAFRFVMVSTDEVYGPLQLHDSAVTETALYDPSSPYAASKAAADHLARAWYRTYGLPTIISNCSNNFGPYQFPDKLIPLTILNIGARNQQTNLELASRICDIVDELLADRARRRALIQFVTASGS